MASIYVLIDPVTHDVWYVGKTEQTLKERLRGHGKPARRDNSWRAKKVRKLQRLGLWQQVKIELVQSVPSEWLDEAERYWIAYYKFIGAPLTNSAEGGKGGQQSLESIEKTRQGLLGKPKSEEHKAKQSATMTGRKQSEATKQKKREANLRRYEDPAERKRTAESSRGRTKSVTSKAQIKATNVATWASSELRTRHSEIMRRVWADRKQREVI